jgi:hypothetical protein
VLLELPWRIGPRWLAMLACGLGAAVLGFGLGVLLTGSPAAAATSLAVSAGICAAHSTYRLRREWPGGNALSRSDRVAVLDAVRDGTDVADPALAPETVAWANTRRFYAERDERQRRTVMIGLAVLLFWVGGSAVEGRDWLLLVGAVLLATAELWWFARALPPRLARAGDRAWAAEVFAQRLVWREHRV